MPKRGLLGIFFLLIAAYLVLVHSTGFAQDIASIGNSAGAVAKTLQGR